MKSARKTLLRIAFVMLLVCAGLSVLAGLAPSVGVGYVALACWAVYFVVMAVDWIIMKTQ
jgi:hypothetical protein